MRVLAPPTLVVTLPGDRRRVLVEEAPSEGEVLSTLKLLLTEVAVLGSFPLKFFFPFSCLPGVGRSGGLFFRAMHSKCYAGPHVVPLLTLLQAFVAFCCRFATKSHDLTLWSFSRKLFPWG